MRSLQVAVTALVFTREETRVMPRGTVKFFNVGRGYGFIEPEEGGPDVFVHYSAIEAEGFKALRQGDTVEFESKTTEKGELATKVVKIKRS